MIAPVHPKSNSRRTLHVSATALLCRTCRLSLLLISRPIPQGVLCTQVIHVDKMLFDLIEQRLG